MKRIFTILVCLVAGYPLGGSPATAGQVLEFWNPSCGPCLDMKPMIDSFVGGGAQIRSINTDSEPELVAKYGVPRVPLFIVLDQAGNEIKRAQGVQTEQEIRAMLSMQRVGQRPAAPAGADPFDVTRATPMPWRCRIMVADGSCGSGQLIDEGLVLTCRHLFDESKQGIVCTFPDGRQFPGTIVDMDGPNDLVAIEIGPTGITPAAVDDSDPVGPVIAGGFGPNGLFRAIVGPIIGQQMPAGATYPAVVMTGAVRPGDSGGAVCNARRAVIGVVWGGIQPKDDQPGFTYFTCGRPFRNFMQRLSHRQGVRVGPMQPYQPIASPPPVTTPGVTSPAVTPPQPQAPQPQAPPVVQPTTPMPDPNRIQQLEDELNRLREQIKQPATAQPSAPGPPGPPGPAGPAGAAAIAEKAAQFGLKELLLMAGLSTGGAGIASYLAVRLGRRGVERLIARHQQPATQGGTGGPSPEPFRSW